MKCIRASGYDDNDDDDDDDAEEDYLGGEGA